jgi:hypothetical protein
MNNLFLILLLFLLIATFSTTGYLSIQFPNKYYYKIPLLCGIIILIIWLLFAIYSSFASRPTSRPSKPLNDVMTESKRLNDVMKINCANPLLRPSYLKSCELLKL